MHGNQVLVLVKRTTTDTSELLHVTTSPGEEPKVNTKCTDVRTGLAADPKDAQRPLLVKLDQRGLVYGSNAQLPLDGTDERWSLEQSPCQRLDRLRDLGLLLDATVKLDDGDVLFPRTLLRLD